MISKWLAQFIGGEAIGNLVTSHGENRVSSLSNRMYSYYLSIQKMTQIIFQCKLSSILVIKVALVVDYVYAFSAKLNIKPFYKDAYLSHGDVL